MPDSEDQVIVTFEGKFIKVISNGEKSWRRAQTLWPQVARLSREHECLHVLGISYSTVPLDILDGYDHPQLFDEVGITRNHRIAWVESNPEAYDTFEFLETVMRNRCFNVRVFSDLAEARKWLLG